MVALTQDRNTPRRENLVRDDPMAANITIFAGSLVCLNAAGNATPGATAVGLKPRGVAQERKVNGATIGEERIRTFPGLHRFANLGADAVTRADIGGTAFIVDDQTVARTNGGATRSAAGIIVDLDARGVWVDIA